MMAVTKDFLEEMGLTGAQVEGVLAALAGDMEEWRAKYEEAARALEECRERERLAAVRAAYRALLEAERVDPRRIEAILRVTPLAELELGEDGRLADEARLAEAIRREWADFIVTEARRPAAVSTPPVSGACRMTRAEIMGIRDAGERQRAIAENHELFGF